MKILAGLLLLSLPAAAQACGMSGVGQGGCGHGASAIYAALAALGYWVMQHSAKETANWVKRAGGAVGTTLAIIGLLGLLCGVGSHINNSRSRSCGSGQAMGMHGGTAAKKCDMHEVRVEAKTAEPAKKGAK